MKTVRVDVSKKYDVIIGENLIKNAGDFLPEKCERAVIVTDDNVEKLYLETVKNSLINKSINVFCFVIPNGEKSKNAEIYIKLLNLCAQNKLTRTDTIIALGGGVVGDLTGFVASSYLRGVGFIQIPTTLLAQVDSSVGGKTAIDLDAGKNLAGAFYQPDVVLCDIKTLDTLPENVFADGCAEVIKYAILGNPKLFAHLDENSKAFDREYVIYECVKMKKDIVCEDEFDTGKRMLLNLGHTAGHAIEVASEYNIPHGSAVAIGMAIMARASYKNGMCSKDCCESIENIIKKFGLPEKTQYDADTLCEIMLSDKKRAGSIVNLIVPDKVGKCLILKYQIDDLKEFIKAGI